MSKKRKSKKRRRIVVVTGTRATYGYSRRLMGLIQKSAKLELQVVVTGMHLLKEYGYSIQEVIRDRYPIGMRVDMMIGGDTPAAWAKSLGVAVQGFAMAFDALNPDMVLVSGDRGEMLAAAMSAAYMNIPVAHLQSGDVSGHIDNSARHAITKLAHIHFPSCEDSAKRVRRLGEESWRIFQVGAPQLDEIVQGKKLPIKELEKVIPFDFSKPVLLVIQHPVLVEKENAKKQMIETMEAIRKLGLQTVVIYPNNDAGGREMISVIQCYEDLPFIKVFRNLERAVFLTLLKHVRVLIGNSSCGILEAPLYKLAAVNIGSRQRGRMQAANVINTEYDRHSIEKAVRRALGDKKFAARLQTCVNPYGNGYSSGKIVKIFETLDLSPRLLDKRITY